MTARTCLPAAARFKRQIHFAGNRCRRPRVIAGRITPPNPMQFADGVARIVTQRILGGRGRQVRSRYAAPEPPFARRFPVRHLPANAAVGCFSCRANQNTFAVNCAFNSGAGQRSLG